jgi:hypothetical protein
MTGTEKTIATANDKSTVETAPALAKTTATPLTPVAVVAEVPPKAPAKRVARKSTPVTKTVVKTSATTLTPAPAPVPSKVVVKASAKPAAKTMLKAAVKPAAKPKTEKPVKAKKPKLVRDSFTIPKAEYTVLDDLKQRATQLNSSVKKSELIRAGVKALAAMSDTAFLAALKAVPTIKTGRPSKA